MPLEQVEPNIVRGEIESVIFVGDDYYTVARVQVEKSNTFVLCGTMPEARMGCGVVARGAWNQHAKFGLRFMAEHVEVSVPTFSDAILKYLSCGIIRGVGPNFAKRLVGAFGDDTLNVIKSQPERLRSVMGVGEKRAEQIVEGVRNAVAAEQAMLWLLNHSITPKLALKLFREYGGATIEIVSENPYVLTKIHGIGFRIADSVGHRIGIPLNSPYRAEAGAMHVLMDAELNGHTAVPLKKLRIDAERLLGRDMAPQTVLDALDTLSRESRIVRHSAGTVEEAVQLKVLWEAERSIAESIKRIIRTGGAIKVPDLDKLIEEYASKVQVERDESQIAAVKLLLTSPVAIMLGAAGCGKTTCLKIALKVARKLEKRIILMAPTGKAAMRMTEATGYISATIQRVLGTNQETGGFLHDDENPLEAAVADIDESSMLDTRIAAAVFKAIAGGAQLWLIGDINQLPSVGSGAVLRDLIDSGIVPVARLTRIHRQAQDSFIVRNAHAIMHGNPKELALGADFHFIETESAEQSLEKIVELVTTAIPQAGWDPMADIQVLTATRKGPVGVENINNALQGVLNPSPPMLVKHGDTRFGVGDRVILTKNNYDLGENGVFNGTMGMVFGVEQAEGNLVVNMETGEQVVFSRELLDDLLLSYCLTGHRSQGSEFPVVIIALDMSQYTVLTRNWLYTAVTRSKKMCVVVGSRKAFIHAIKTATDMHRCTMLPSALRTKSGQ